LTCGGITGGWMRIANVDTSQGDDCPSGWNKTIQLKQLCRGLGDGAGCYSAHFTNNKFEYNSICGKLHTWLSKGSLSAFAFNHAPTCSLDNVYFDGVSITVRNPRKHVWSYAVGLCCIQVALT